MAATLYQDKNYGGPTARVVPGQRLVARGDPYAPGALVGYKGPLRGGNSYAEDLDNAVSSLRVDAGVVLTVSDSTSRSSQGSRTFVGPFESADLSAQGLEDRISAAEVHAIVAPATGAIGGPSPAVELYGDYGARGRRALLDVGDYSEARLRSAEVDFRAGSAIRSIKVAAGALAVLYAGPAFDGSLDSVAIPGPAYVDDLDRWGMLDRVKSVRVFATARGAAPPHIHQPSPDARKAGENSGALSARQLGISELASELAELRAQLASTANSNHGFGYRPGGAAALENPKRAKWYRRANLGSKFAVLLFVLFLIVMIAIAVMRASPGHGAQFAGKRVSWADGL